ncbi:MAG TPA: zinc-dependent alcohol dehydrogenase family protein [Methylophilaceae bacterium]|jgi:propanol-preferring alcohol dehydrogenase
MKAMLLERPGAPLRYVDLPDPVPGHGEVLLRVLACGICRTDLHIADGDLPHPKLPLVLGHEIVGEVIDKGPAVDRFSIGDRVGVPWLGWTCGQCDYCTSGRENLCDEARFTGYHRDGGFAELTVADQRYCFAIDSGFSDSSAAPLLCAGLIGYRALRLAGNGKHLGIYGFGAAAHLVTQVALARGWNVYAMTRAGDTAAQRFAMDMGATWAGNSIQMPPHPLDAALIFAPVGELVPAALAASVKGASIVCAGIHMTDIPSFPYNLLWGERIVRSVANLTRHDGEEFMHLAASIPVRAHPVIYPLSRANEVLEDLRSGAINGAAVLIPVPG